MPKKNKSGSQKKREKAQRDEWNARNEKLKGVLTDRRKNSDECEIVKRLLPNFNDSDLLSGRIIGRITPLYAFGERLCRKSPYQILEYIKQTLPDHTFIDLYDTKWYSSQAEQLLPYFTPSRNDLGNRLKEANGTTIGYEFRMEDIPDDTLPTLQNEYNEMLECLPDKTWIVSSGYQHIMGNLLAQVGGDQSDAFYLSHRKDSYIPLCKHSSKASVEKSISVKMNQINDKGKFSDLECGICAKTEKCLDLDQGCVGCGEWMCDVCANTILVDNLDPETNGDTKEILITMKDWTCPFCKGSYYGGTDNVAGGGCFSHIPYSMLLKLKYIAHKINFGEENTDPRDLGGSDNLIPVEKQGRTRNWEEWEFRVRIGVGAN